MNFHLEAVAVRYVHACTRMDTYMYVRAYVYMR